MTEYETLNVFGLTPMINSAKLEPLKEIHLPLLSAKGSTNTGEYFDVIKDKTLIKEKDKEIEELINGEQLSNTTFVIEIDDFKELDSFITLLDPSTPKGVQIYNTETFPNFSSLKEKPKLLIKAFKFNFISDETQEYKAIEKHQLFSNNMNKVYTKMVKYIKSVFDDASEKPTDYGVKQKKKSKNAMKAQQKLSDLKNKSVVVSSFKVLFNIDDKSEVHVCIY
jgi:hypothetical protein